MVLSPFDVEHKTFRTSLRGYAEEEVDEFLDEVVSSLRENEQRLKEATERVAVLENELSAAREAESAIRRTFIAAQRTADQMIEEARVEAKRLVADARAEAAAYEAEKVGEKNKAQSELEAMQQALEGLKDRLRAFSEETWDRASGIEAEIQEVISSFDLEERTYEVPALVAAEEDDEFEYYEEEEEPPSSESPEVGEEEAMAVDLEEAAEAETGMPRARPRRPWEREAPSED